MVHHHHLQRFLEGFPEARVLCIGDVMLDRFVYGAVERVSAEAPIPILHVDSQRAMLGGVGNVARNVAALGAQAALIGVVGNDAAADQITALAESEPNIAPRLVSEAERPSTVKTRYVAGGQQLLRADEETTTPISPTTVRRIVEALRTELGDADVMVLSDYTKGVLTDEVLKIAIAEARAAGVPIIADPKRTSFGAYAGVSLLKPNLSELETASRMPCDDDTQVEDAARRAMSDCNIDAILVSRSEQGVTLVERDMKARHFSAKAPEVFDVSGAGDTVVATTAVALASGAALEVAAELANVAGGIVVGKVGTAVVRREELASGLLAAEVSDSEAKIHSTEGAIAAVDRWRKRGLKVGFTNGCFDLLHPGHISLLREARASCDRLIIALNSDESVRRLKGSERPFQHEMARSIVLASLSMVDLVVVFSEDTPAEILELLRPDILVKGGDYTIDEVVGADFVRSYGGEVKLAALIPGHSSSDMIARVSNRDAPKARGGLKWSYR